MGRSSIGWLFIILLCHRAEHPSTSTPFANASIPIHVVGDSLGQASIETTRADLHTDNTALQNAAARMNEYPREATTSNSKCLNPLATSGQ